MSAVELFETADWSVRAVEVDGEPWFVASDVAKALGYSATSAALRLLDDEDKGVQTLHTPGGRQSFTTITEGALYELVVRSTLDGARRFKRWVTHDVLPQIRRTGSYVTPATTFELPQTMAEALRLAADSIDRAEHAEQALAEVAPKVEAFDELMSADGCLTMEATAKVVGLGRNTLFRRLREIGVLQANRLPYQRYMHYFEIELGTHVRNGEHYPHHTTRVKPEGVDFIRRRLAAQHAHLELVKGDAS